jgi:RNA polymerase sigma-70 factor (ECF subfamily)
MPADDSFAALMLRLRAGDNDAADRVFRQFAGRLIALARSRLDAALRQKVDPEEVMLSAYKSFFRRHADGEFDLDGWEGLWGLLTRITLHKCWHQVDHFRAACRDVRREAGPGTRAAADEEDWQALAREPTPPEAVMLADTVAQLLRGLDERDREILTLLLQRHTAAEISVQLNRPQRTVYRVLERVKQRLQKMSESDS